MLKYTIRKINQSGGSEADIQRAIEESLKTDNTTEVANILFREKKTKEKFLLDEFDDSNNKKKNLVAFLNQPKYNFFKITHFRDNKGDGNCAWRALYLCICRTILNKGKDSQIAINFTNLMINCKDESLDNIKYNLEPHELIRFKKGVKQETVSFFTEIGSQFNTEDKIINHLNNNKDLDLKIIYLLKAIVGEWLTDTNNVSDTIVNGESLLTYLKALKDGEVFTSTSETIMKRNVYNILLGGMSLQYPDQNKIDKWRLVVQNEIVDSNRIILRYARHQENPKKYNLPDDAGILSDGWSLVSKDKPDEQGVRKFINVNEDDESSEITMLKTMNVDATQIQLRLISYVFKINFMQLVMFNEIPNIYIYSPTGTINIDELSDTEKNILEIDAAIFGGTGHYKIMYIEKSEPEPKKGWTELPSLNNLIMRINDEDVKKKYSNCDGSDKNTFPQVSELHEIYLGTEKDGVFTLTHQLIENNDIVKNHADKLYICTK
jgi:hypothetical protein